MTTTPQWLPEIICVDGEWQEVCSMLYNIFQNDFHKIERRYEDRLLWWDRRILNGRYEEGFWHLITKDDLHTKERLFEPRRAERLPWCGPTISNYCDCAVKAWDYKEHSKRIRTYLWLEPLDYVIILEKRNVGKREIAFLITAYHVDGESTRRSLRRKFQERLG
jgi:hypothetical protein